MPPEYGDILALMSKISEFVLAVLEMITCLHNTKYFWLSKFSTFMLAFFSTELSSWHLFFHFYDNILKKKMSILQPLIKKYYLYYLSKNVHFDESYETTCLIMSSHKLTSSCIININQQSTTEQWWYILLYTLSKYAPCLSVKVSPNINKFQTTPATDRLSKLFTIPFGIVLVMSN